MTKPLILLELNEINFEFVAEYAAKGLLPALSRLMGRHGYAETTSEQAYEELEPWIQWVTAHTGLSLAEHGIFRLGDVKGRNLKQIWERLEEEGLSVGAVSPMNALNALKSPAFFVPDPWTDTPASGGFLIQKVAGAVAQAVNDNAQSRITAESALSLAAGLAYFGRRTSYLAYAQYLIAARKKPWSRALFLDRFLGDVYVDSYKKTRPAFSSLFLNAGAHIQHHYMFSSGAYKGRSKNPEWYVRRGVDPLLEVYQLYDQILQNILDVAPDARLMVATALHQDPHERLTFYWRLRRHEDFLTTLGVPFLSVEPRMSRDFLVKCHSDEDARKVQEALENVRSVVDGDVIFEVDNRGRDLFVTLIYSKDITTNFYVATGERHIRLDDKVAFVAIKNGHHNGCGYFLDTANLDPSTDEVFPLLDLPKRILSHFGLRSDRSRSEMVDSSVSGLAEPVEHRKQLAVPSL